MSSVSQVLSRVRARNHGLGPLLSACLLLIAATLAGCISTPPVDGLPQAPQNVAPVAAQAPDLAPYTLQIGDVVEVKLMLNPELNDEVAVRPDGKISTTLAQDVPAYGLTAAQLAASLEVLYAQQLRSPHVAVLVRSFAPSRIYVTGEVTTPGEFITVGPNLTLTQAIARAGGIKASARVDQVLILRRGAGEAPQTFYTNYKAAVSGADPASDVRLATYDVVFVPRSGVADAYLYFQQYFEQFVPVSFGITPSLQ